MYYSGIIIVNYYREYNDLILKMWEEVKQNFAQYKNDMTSLSTLKDNLQKYGALYDSVSGSSYETSYCRRQRFNIPDFKVFQEL